MVLSAQCSLARFGGEVWSWSERALTLGKQRFSLKH